MSKSTPDITLGVDAQGHPAFGFECDGMFITDPSRSDCGRFAADPERDYGLLAAAAAKLAEANSALRQSVAVLRYAGLSVCGLAPTVTRTYRPTTVQIDAFDGVFDAYENGRRWNGWAMPLFNREQADRLCAAIAEAGGVDVRFDAERDGYIDKQEGEEDVCYEAETVETDDGQSIKVYGIGAGSWCWEIASEGQPQAPKMPRPGGG